MAPSAPGRPGSVSTLATRHKPLYDGCMAGGHPKPIVGLTGGIASGKSTVARWLAELGAGWVDADAVAREVVAPGSNGLGEIVATFGDGVLLADGSLDRKRLGSIVFGDAVARAKLESITHPRIAQLSSERLEALQQSEVPYVVYEAALLVETGAYRSMAALVVVAADEQVRIARLRSRDGLSETEARQRIASQLPLERKLEVADYVIRNDTTLSDARDQTERVHAALLEKLQRA